MGGSCVKQYVLQPSLGNISGKEFHEFLVKLDALRRDNVGITEAELMHHLFNEFRAVARVVDTVDPRPSALDTSLQRDIVDSGLAIANALDGRKRPNSRAIIPINVETDNETNSDVAGAPQMKPRPAAPKKSISERDISPSAQLSNIATSNPLARYVLVVDDSKISLRLAERTLQSLRFSAVTCKDGASALEVLKANPNKFVFAMLDIIMEGMDGISLLHQIRRDSNLSHLKIIMQSGLEDAKLKDLCLSAGAACVLVKPVKLDTLREVLRTTLCVECPVDVDDDDKNDDINTNINTTARRKTKTTSTTTKPRRRSNPHSSSDNSASDNEVMIAVNGPLDLTVKTSKPSICLICHPDLNQDQTDDLLLSLCQKSRHWRQFNNDAFDAINLIMILTTTMIIDSTRERLLTKFKNIDPSCLFILSLPSIWARLPVFVNEVDMQDNDNDDETKNKKTNSWYLVINGSGIVCSMWNWESAHSQPIKSSLSQFMPIVVVVNDAHSPVSQPVSVPAPERKLTISKAASTSRRSMTNPSMPDLPSDAPVIVVIDDSAISAKVTMHKLSKIGFRTIYMNSGRRALELIKTTMIRLKYPNGLPLDRQNSPILTSTPTSNVHSEVSAAESVIESFPVLQRLDLVLLDLVMPDMDGYAVLNAIKNDVVMKDMPVVIVSGVEDVQLGLLLIEKGAKDVMTKPIQMDLLRVILADLGILLP